MNTLVAEAREGIRWPDPDEAIRSEPPAVAGG